MDLTGIGSIASFAKSVIERIFPPKMSAEEKVKAQLLLQEMLEERENKLIDAQRAIMVAELQQGDNYTKRARPTLIYGGLAFIFLVHVLFPIVSYFTRQKLPGLTLPDQFWWAWGGACSIWIIGRSAERRGINNKIIQAITGGLNAKG